MRAEFDYQWDNLPDPALELTPERIAEFLDYVQLQPAWFNGKDCLDAGCGSGRWTWAMMQLGAHVESADISLSAIHKAAKINPMVVVWNISKPRHDGEQKDLVFCWGVLHHMEDPHNGFLNLANLVKRGGYLHIMVYHKSTQWKYLPLRKLWRILPGEKSKRLLCKALARGMPNGEHGWWDALNPKFNHSFYPVEVRGWFMEAGFYDITLTKEFNINVRGRKA